MTYGRKRYGNSSYYKEPEIVEVPLPVIPDVIHNEHIVKEKKGGLLSKISSILGFEIKTEELIIIGLILLFLFNKNESQDEDTDIMIPILLYLLF